MPITSITSDPEELTLTVIADFTAPVKRLWDAYMDPRQIEKFWGPVEFPATFLRHDNFPGGLTKYRMVGPQGEISCGYWEWLSIREHEFFEVLDGFAHEDGSPNREMPTMRMTFEFTETALGSRLNTTTYFPSAEALEKLLAMGMEEGMKSAMSQIDDVLADLAAFAADLPTEAQIIDDTHVRISRVVKGPVGLVWRAHTEPEMLQRWQLGPDGWSMPVCEMSAEEGFSYRSMWENDETGERFGFGGVIKEVAAPHRLVSTEKYLAPDDLEGKNSPETLNELTLKSTEGSTLVTYVITYPNAEIRDQILATGMADGMEMSFARLEQQLADA